MKRKFVNNNKGMAMVSVLIAVAFITILATALLYISFNNFQMKVVNYESKVNFYETEHDLVVASTAIRNAVYNNASNPMQELKDAVGYVEIAGQDGNGTYDPEKIAHLVYGDTYVTVGDGANAWQNTIDNTQISFSAFNVGGTNFIITDEANGVKKVVLKDLIISHMDVEKGTSNRIITDLVYRIKQDNVSDDPGGIGEFSMLTDSLLAAGDGYPIRIVTYGNVFIGPDSYEYYPNNTDPAKVINPAGADAINLAGSTVLTIKGDYMVVFGNIVLDQNAVLYVASGKLTVYGDIILKGNASFICKGELYFPEGDKPGTTSPYSIDVSGGNSANVIPSATELASTAKTVSATDYASVLQELKLDDDDTSNDGILRQIISATHYDKMESEQNSDRDNGRVDIDGMAYRPMYNGTATQNLNGGGELQAALIFNSANATIQNTSFTNTTLISFAPITFNNQHTYMFSQIGEVAFDELTAYEATDYDATVHNLKCGTLDLKCNEIFNANANVIVNRVLQKSTGGSSGTPIVDVVFGYENWSRD